LSTASNESIAVCVVPRSRCTFDQRIIQRKCSPSRSELRGFPFC
jgi:hypothetical protein